MNSDEKEPELTIVELLCYGVGFIVMFLVFCYLAYLVETW